MTTTTSASQQIAEAVLAWDGVTASPDDVRDVIALLRINYDRLHGG